MRILVLGGTRFVGRHIVEAAVARGHTVTLFHRGRTHADRFPQLETLHGDRDGQLDALRGRTWDAVVDVSGYVPRVVRMSAELLAPHVEQYVFVSTVSVYRDLREVGADETAPTATLDDPTSEDVSAHYGALKAACERVVEEILPGRTTTIRPGLVVGPGDHTGRFTHWPWRMAQGGEVLCPGDGVVPTQWIDGRDLGGWIVRTIEDRTVGVYNALGPAPGRPMREVLEACNAAAGGGATLTWVDADFLAAQAVAGWSDMPMWIEPKGEYAGFGTTSNARAIAAGLTLRPVLETARDTLAWLATLPADTDPKVRTSGLDRAREATVLAASRFALASKARPW